jgi:diguanylate cyclase (GGDEF)-like protein
MQTDSRPATISIKACCRVFLVLRNASCLALLLVSLASASFAADPAVPEAGNDYQALLELQRSDPALALERLEQRLQHAVPDDPVEHGQLLELRGTLYREAGRLDAAERDANEMIDLLQSLDVPTLRADAAFLLGTVLAERGELAGALTQFQRAQRLLADTDATDTRIRVINAIAVTHTFLGNFERARNYYEDALQLARASGDRSNEATALGNLALTVAEIDGPEAGIAIHREALALAREIDDRRGAAQQLANLCMRLSQVGELDAAEATCLDALEQQQSLGMQRLQAGTRMSLGDVHYERDQPSRAENEYRAALALAEGRIPSVEQPALEKLGAALENQGRFEEANDVLKRLIELRREVAESRQTERVEELEVRSLSEQKQREIELLQMASRLQQEQLARRNLLLIATVAALVLLAVLTLVIWRALLIRKQLEDRLSERNSALEEAVSTISNIARRDELTGLYNRRAFIEAANREMARSRRDQQPLALAIGDIDHFKRLNDSHGHGVGDEVLKATANRMREAVRGGDLVCRWGGEEFLFLLHGACSDRGESILERIRQQFADMPVETASGTFPITLTFGVAAVESDLNQALDAADAAMYRGKRSGRNRVVVASASRSP